MASCEYAPSQPLKYLPTSNTPRGVRREACGMHEHRAWRKWQLLTVA